jgi:hypothetical protein
MGARRRRWPWPREYAAIVAALHETESELRRLEALRRLETGRACRAQAALRDELDKQRKGSP